MSEQFSVEPMDEFDHDDVIDMEIASINSSIRDLGYEVRFICIVLAVFLTGGLFGFLNGIDRGHQEAQGIVKPLLPR